MPHIRIRTKEQYQKTETYLDEGTSVTKHYYNAKHAYVCELIQEKDGAKVIKYFTPNGVLSKIENFVGDKREGMEIRYLIPKANESIKSSKTYSEGKLHGECLTFNEKGEIIKQEVFARGKLTLKYLRNEGGDITNIKIVDKENIINLPQLESDKLEVNK